MTTSHCLICGKSVVSGLYCYDCLWEIRRLRLEGEEDIDSWMEENIAKRRPVPPDSSILTIDSFQ
ncbi:MAG: nucleotide-binding protein [Thermoplasmatales archaeon]